MGIVGTFIGKGRMQRQPENPEKLQGLMPFSEIAAELGITRHRAFVLYQNGMKKIRKVLMENPDLADSWYACLFSGELRIRGPQFRDEDLPDCDYYD